MKNTLNLDKEKKRKEKKVAIRRLRETLRRSIIADLKVKFGNKAIEANLGQIENQIQGILEEKLGKADAKAS